MNEELTASQSDNSNVPQSNQSFGWGGRNCSAAELIKAQMQSNSATKKGADFIVDDEKVMAMILMGIDIMVAAEALKRSKNDISVAVGLCFDTDITNAGEIGSSKTGNVENSLPLEACGLEISSDVTNKKKSVSFDDDRDFALAIQFQEQERQKFENSRGRNQGVIVGGSSNEGKMYCNSQSLKVLNKRWGADEADDCAAAILQEEQISEYQKSSDERMKAVVLEGGGCRRAKSNLYRLSTGEIVSKHDSELCGLANARELSGFAGVGDLSIDGIKLDNQTANSLRAKLIRSSEGPKGVAAAGRVEKSLHATSEGVLDPRTRLILHNMINARYLSEVLGIVKSGKEACVFYGIAPPLNETATVKKGTSFSQSIAESAMTNMSIDTDSPRPVAIKVFKTTLNEFSNRQDYVDGDHRYRGVRFNKQSRARMFRLWAEKEARNLARASKEGILVPKPLLQREHILIMEFLGQDGWPAPQLKEVDLDAERWRTAYINCVETTRLLYMKCALVHGDLSEYNILYHEEKCYFIDFGQAVHNSHPRAMELLERDLSTVEAFMRKCHVACLGKTIAFEYVTQYRGESGLGLDVLEKLLDSVKHDGEEESLKLLTTICSEVTVVYNAERSEDEYSKDDDKAHSEDLSEDEE